MAPFFVKIRIMNLVLVVGVFFIPEGTVVHIGVNVPFGGRAVSGIPPPHDYDRV